jgi:hypothetical protein
MSDAAQKAKHLFLKRFFLIPDNGIYDVEFGKWLVGYDNKISPREIGMLFQWGFMSRLMHQPVNAFRKLILFLGIALAISKNLLKFDIEKKYRWFF